MVLQKKKKIIFNIGKFDVIDQLFQGIEEKYMTQK